MNREKTDEERIYTVTMNKFKRFSTALRAIAVAVLIVLSVVSVSSCTAVVGDDYSDESGNMNIDIGQGGTIRNGTEYFTYRVEEGYEGIVSVTISRNSGRFDLDIYPTDRKDDKAYSGRELDSASFSVILSECGEYKVRIAAKDFVGDYEISWKTVKKEA